MKPLAHRCGISVLAVVPVILGAGTSGCTQSKIICGDGAPCESPGPARVTLTLAGPPPAGATVTACHLSACLTAQLPAGPTSGAGFRLSAQANVYGGVSGGPQPQVDISWLESTANGDTFSVTVKDAAGGTLATISETATYVSQTVGGGSCFAVCPTLVMTPVVPRDAGTDAAPPPMTCRPAAPCPAGWLAYTDTICSPPTPSGAEPCTPHGDNLCYLPCSSDVDCRKAGFTSCGSLTFFHGSDVGSQVPVCNGTAQLPVCTAADAGTDAGPDAGESASFFCYRSPAAGADAGDVACTVGQTYCLLSKDKTQTQIYGGSCPSFKTSSKCSTVKPTCDCVPESSYVNCTCSAHDGIVTVSCAQI
jgi:hypothetical protein